MLILAMMIVITSCGSSQDALEGKWTKTDGGIMFNEVEFFKDGTYVSDHANYNGAYSIESDRIKFSGTLVEPVTLSYKIDGNKLFFYINNTNEDSTATFERVKQ